MVKLNSWLASQRQPAMVATHLPTCVGCIGLQTCGSCCVLAAVFCMLPLCLVVPGGINGMGSCKAHSIASGRQQLHDTVR